MDCRRVLLGARTILWAGVAIVALTSCGDDDSFSPVAKDRGYEYAYASANDLSKTPCNEMRKGRNAVIGRDKDLYTCIFDRVDSVYLWAGEYDTLTAGGREFIREESSSSIESSDSDGSSSSSYSSFSCYLYSTKSYGGYSKDSYSFALDSRDDLLNPDVTYGTLVDERDGQVYKTVVVGNRVWMAQNLNFAGNDDFPYVEDESVCFNYDEANCALLGRLYSRVAAMNNPDCALNKPCNIGNSAIRGVCPNGWHVPTYADATALQDVFRSRLSEAKSAKTWEGSRYGAGSNSSGFSMPASGCLDLGDEDFENGGEAGYVWAYIQSPNMKYLIFLGSNDYVDIHSGYGYDILMSVRCVSDDTLKVASSSSSARSSSSVSSSSSSYSSSSSAKSSSSSLSSSSRELSTPITEKGEQFNPDIDYGTMTDPRDGKTYKTVVVEGKTWMAENLNFAGNEDFPLAEQYSLCSYGEEENCELYGRLYTREAAMNSDTCAYNTSCSLADPLQGVCPAGWHIPSLTEATDLKDLASDSFLTLTSAKGWGNDTLSVYSGDDTYGLSFLPAGDKSGNDYKYFGANAFMWANIPGDKQRYFVINASEKKAFIHSGYSVNVLYLSVRCVKDE